MIHQSHTPSRPSLYNTPVDPVFHPTAIGGTGDLTDNIDLPRMDAATNAALPNANVARRWPDALLSRRVTSPTISQSERAFLSGRQGCCD